MTSKQILLRKITDCLRWADEHDDIAETRFNVRAFERMQRRLSGPATFGNGGSTQISDKQASWVEDVHEKIFGEPNYRNSFSAGEVPRGKQVPTPPVLLNLPKRPPTRRKDTTS